MPVSTATLPVPRAPRYVYSDTVTKPRWQLIMHQLSQATRLPPSPTHARAQAQHAAHRRRTAPPRPANLHAARPSGLWPRAPRRASPCAQHVASRRIIVELHSEWGLPTSFFADVAQLRALYEPLGCRVTLATVLRHPIAWYLSFFNWRASNAIPLCQWQPPADGISRQVGGDAGAATIRMRGCNPMSPGCNPMSPGCNPMPSRSAATHCPSRSRDQRTETGGSRELAQRLQPHRTQAATLCDLGCNPMTPRWNSPALSVSILAHFDVVGLTELLDESLLLLADRAGLQRLGYSTLAANNKPEHPAKAKQLLKALLAQVGATLSEPFTPLPPVDSAEYAAAYEGARDIASGAALGWSAAEWEAHQRREAQSEWGGAALGAMAALNEVSMVYVEKRGGDGKNKADCNFYPCEEGLKAAKGVWSRQLCPTDQDGLGSARGLLRKMLNRTTADRAVHAYVVRALTPPPPRTCPRTRTRAAPPSPPLTPPLVLRRCVASANSSPSLPAARQGWRSGWSSSSATAPSWRRGASRLSGPTTASCAASTSATRARAAHASAAPQTRCPRSSHAGPRALPACDRTRDRARVLRGSEGERGGAGGCGRAGGRERVLAPRSDGIVACVSQVGGPVLSRRAEVVVQALVDGRGLRRGRDESSQLPQGRAAHLPADPVLADLLGGHAA